MATISSTLTLIDNMSGKLETIKKAVEDVANAFEGVSTSAENAEKQVNDFDWAGFGKKCDDFGDKATKAGAKLTLGVTTPLVALGKSAYTTATDYETAFTGIRKTTDATEEEFAALYQGILDLSENTPTGFVELAGIGEVAGQLGVAKDELLGFIEAFDALQVSTNIQGEEGATDMARFLNIMDGSTANIKRVGGAIVDLGNNYATTENDILRMSTRMAATGNLVGFSVPDILALSTVMSSLGIEAEAGGSAAGKLMKQMQLAAEVGVGSWQTLISGAGSFFGEDFESIHDLEMTMDAMKKADISEFAASLGMTTDELNSAIDTAKDLEYFADVSGKTAAQFEKDWADNPAQSMIDFFAGLAELDESGVQSAVSKLNEMGLTEIRLSNMVAAMASQPEMLRDALAMAYAAYAKDPAANAMTEEAAKFYGTQASQNAMVANKWENTKANFGENLVTALQPAVDKVNELLTAFNGLSEVDQDRIIALMGALVFTGPAVTAIGGVAKAVGNISTAIGKIKDLGGAKGLFDKLAGFLATPVGSALAIATAVGLIAAAIDSIPTEAEKILSAVSNIQITVDEESVNETLAAIRKVREEAETLKNPEISRDYENTSAAVGMGFGTNTMYGNALGYESAKANADIDNIIANYSGQMREAEERIARATTDAERTEWFGKYQDLEAQMNADVAARRALYSQKVSELFNGMAAQYPEAAQAMEKVSKDYDLMGVILQADNFDWDAYANEAAAQADWDKIMKTMYSKAFDLGYMGDQDESIFMNMLENGGYINNAGWIQTLYDTVLDEMKNGVQTVSDNPVLAGFLQSIISDESVLQNLDFTQLQGALEGMVGALDFKQAVDKASESGNVNLFGQYLVEGLAEGVETNAGLIEPPFTTVKENALSALRAAFGIASPSTVMAAEGIFIPQGIAQGITTGTPAATAAIIATSNAVLAAARTILTYGAGSSIGYNVVVGLAAGIQANSGMAVSAARSLANRVTSTLRSALKVHSPSRVTYEIGDFTGMGFVDGLLANADSAESAMGKIVDAAESAWNTAAWSDIALFAGMEHDQLVSDAKDAVKISDADIRKIRDLAEREVINHFTTAKVEVQMTNNNNINSDMDIDGIINQLEVKVEERLEAVAEGVYA